MVNGRIDKYQFEEGYCQAEKSSSDNNKDNFTFCYYDQDHLGNIREVVDASGVVKQVTNYFPFGATYADRNAEKGTNIQEYKYNGKELDRMHGLNTYDYGARQYDPILGRWDRIDRFCEKYYNISPYAYCANNPIRSVDINGDSIWIQNGENTVLYHGGLLYNSDGNVYDGKISKFLSQVVVGLDNLSKTLEGKSLISELDESSNNFVIEKGIENKFIPFSTPKAGANLSELQKESGDTRGSNGSGGTIYWNPRNQSGGLDVHGGTSRPAYIGLGHEMAHASDANRGILHFDKDYQGYAASFYGLKKSEWRAVFRENLIRLQAQVPLRAYYGYDISTGIPKPIGPRLVGNFTVMGFNIVFPICYPN